LGFQSNHIYGSERLLPLIAVAGVVRRSVLWPVKSPPNQSTNAAPQASVGVMKRRLTRDPIELLLIISGFLAVLWILYSRFG
jgi:hypothetical protein